MQHNNKRDSFFSLCKQGLAYAGSTFWLFYWNWHGQLLNMLAFSLIGTTTFILDYKLFSFSIACRFRFGPAHDQGLHTLLQDARWIGLPRVPIRVESYPRTTHVQWGASGEGTWSRPVSTWRRRGYTLCRHGCGCWPAVISTHASESATTSAATATASAAGIEAISEPEPDRGPQSPVATTVALRT